MKVCCFTGHREIPAAERQQLSISLSDEVKKLTEQGVTVFRNGGALGFDTLAALCVLRLKNENPDIKLYIDVPHRGQEMRWREEDRERYHYILSRADEVHYLAEHYYRGCMHVRNRHMVDNSDVVIAYVRKMSGGSFYTMQYADETGVPVIRV